MKINKKSIRKLPVFGRMSLTRGQERELDALWAIAVKKRAWEVCEYCLRAGRLEAHHFYGRRKKTLRHIVSNGFSLCHTHHRLAEEQPAKFIEWAISKRGEKWYDDLSAYANEVKVYKDFTIIKQYLQEFIDD